MVFDLDFQGFLSSNRISQEVWEKSGCDWDGLLRIARSHDENVEQLRDTAEFFARVIQKIPSVHSVRWRVKETSHLLEKIVRKSAEGSEKYLGICADNYSEVVKDLVGLRALHLFKEETLEIDSAIRKIWLPTEDPVVYVRDGDQQGLSAEFALRGIGTREHPAGYRSVHYVFSSQLTHKKVFVEVQTRTLFEEGWSEIDHRVRYPNFSSNASVSYFLAIFNRLAGSADEMGSFVQILATTLHEQELRISEANRQNEASLRKMESAILELEELRQQDVEPRASVSELKKQIANLRRDLSVESMAPSVSRSLQDDLRLLTTGVSANWSMAQLDGANAAQKALAQLDGASAAQRALVQLDRASVAQKALAQLDGASAAQKALAQLDGANAAQKALAQLDGANAAQRALAAMPKDNVSGWADTARSQILDK